jgi:hypothetical protein
MTPNQKRFIEAVNPEPISAKSQFRMDLRKLERLSRDVGFWNSQANLKDEDDNYDLEAIQKYEELRNKQLDLFQTIINKYEVTLY